MGRTNAACGLCGTAPFAEVRLVSLCFHVSTCHLSHSQTLTDPVFMNAKGFLHLYTVITNMQNINTFGAEHVKRFDNDKEDGDHWEAGQIKNAVALVTETPTIMAPGGNLKRSNGAGFFISCPQAKQVHRHYHACHLDERGSWPTIANYGEFHWKKDWWNRANRDKDKKPAAKKGDDEENKDEEEQQDDDFDW